MAGALKRVLVVGCAGSGKSTLARAIAERTGLPLVHLDAHYWRPGWQAPGAEAWARQVEAIAAGEAWVIDGNYSATMPPRRARADTLIFLDLPTRVCLRRVVLRSLRWRGRSRPDMAQGCPERLDWEFLRFVLAFRRERRPKLLDLLRRFPGTRVHLTSARAVRAYLARL